MRPNIEVNIFLWLVFFYNSLRWPIYIFNLVDITKLFFYVIVSTVNQAGQNKVYQTELTEMW